MRMWLLILMILGTYQSVMAMSLEQAIQQGLTQNEDLTVKTLELERLQARLESIQADLRPQLNGSMSLRRYLEKPTISLPFDPPPMLPLPDEIPLAQDYQAEMGLSVTQVVYTFGSMQAAIDAVKQNMVLATSDKNRARIELIELIRSAYFQALASDRAYQIAADSLANAKTNESLLRQGTAGGRSSQSDLVRIRADIQARKPALVQRRLEQDLTYQYLKVLIGYEPERELKLSDRLVGERGLPSRAELIQRMLKNEPGLALLRDKAQLFELSAQAQEARLRPNLAAFGSLNYNAQSDTLATDSFKPVSAVGLQLNVPLYDGHRSDRLAQQDRIEAKKSRQELQKAQRYLEMELDSALKSITALKQLITDLDEAIDLAKRSYQISQKRFQVGKTSPLELNDVEKGLTSLKDARLQALLQLNKNYSKIDRLVGEDL